MTKCSPIKLQKDNASVGGKSGGDTGGLVRFSYCYTVQYKAKICNAHNVCQLAESEASINQSRLWY